MITGANEDLTGAIGALMDGREQDARELLLHVLKQDPDNEQAWLWMSRAVATDVQRQVCLETVLEINPNNKAARRRLGVLRSGLSDQAGGDVDHKEAESLGQVADADGGQERDASRGYATVSRVVAIAALSVIATCLIAMLLTGHWDIKPLSSPTLVPTAVPSSTPTESQRIKEYLQESAPALERYNNRLEAFLDEFPSILDANIRTSPSWQADLKLAMQRVMDAENRLLDIEPPEPLEPYRREMSEGARHFEEYYDIILTSLENPEDTTLLERGREEAQLSISHHNKAYRLLEQTLVKYDLEDYEW